ncbi:MAG: 30S ribosomal protein S6, partial [Actinomycetota bacterium]|nr:30S ribosomal protein S6 [Actinomycetota bacterium]
MWGTVAAPRRASWATQQRGPADDSCSQPRRIALRQWGPQPEGVIMRHYEMMLIMSDDLDDEAVQALVERV